jgi:hypothetical protein
MEKNKRLVGAHLFVHLTKNGASSGAHLFVHSTKNGASSDSPPQQLQ